MPSLGTLGGTIPHDALLVPVVPDGAARNNGSVGATASFAVVFPTHRELDRAELLSKLLRASNNTAELVGAVTGLQTVAVKVPEEIPVVFTDSTTTIMAVVRNAGRTLAARAYEAW
jgi:ribonuclease HI